MSFKDFSTSHSDRKPTPLSAKPGNFQPAKATQPSRAPVAKPRAPRQSPVKH